MIINYHFIIISLTYKCIYVCIEKLIIVARSPNGRPPVSSKPPLPPSHSQGGVGCARIGGATTPTSRSSSGVVVGTRRRAATDLGSPAAIEMAKARAMQAAQEPRPVGLLETDLDAAEPAVVTVDLGVGGSSSVNHPVTPTSCNNQPGKKTRSLLNLNHTSSRQGRDGNHHLVNENALRVPQSPGSGCRNSSDRQDHHHNSVGSCINQRPHKSMEFLLDKENLHFVKVSREQFYLFLSSFISLTRNTRR